MPSVTCGYNKLMRGIFGAGLALFWLGAASAQGAGPTATPSLSVSLGASAWHGKFGAPSNTDISSVLLGARYKIGGLRLSASLPRMTIRSDGTFFAGLGGTPLFVAPNIASLKRKRDGLGDLTVGAAYLIPNLAGSGLDLDLSGRAKIPTATKKSQLSTGKADYAFRGELSKSLGRFTPSVSAGYRIFGDNAPWDFRNGVELTAGATYAIGDAAALLASYEYREAATQFIPDSHEVVLGFSTPLATDRLRLSAYGSAGLSQGTSDISGGVSLSVNLW
jgi:hypothetical protein